MRLVSLTANKASFHPVNFRPTGPSYILGKQKPRAQEANTGAQTYNGVGKSLLLYLINFCLGAEAKDSFLRQLDGWEFHLKVNLDGRDVIISRKVIPPEREGGEKIKFGDDEISVEEYRERLQSAVFPGAKDVKFLTFRSLIGLFLRPGKTAYNSCDGIHYSEKAIQKLTRSAYLLGLDIKLVAAKYDLREEIQQMAEMSNRFAKDAIIKEYFLGKKDVNLDIRELTDQLTALELNLKEFKVADNYHDVERQANEFRASLQKIRNQEAVLKNRIGQIDESLAAKPEVSEIASIWWT